MRVLHRRAPAPFPLLVRAIYGFFLSLLVFPRILMLSTAKLHCPPHRASLVGVYRVRDALLRFLLSLPCFHPRPLLKERYQYTFVLLSIAVYTCVAGVCACVLYCFCKWPRCPRLCLHKYSALCVCVCDWWCLCHSGLLCTCTCVLLRLQKKNKNPNNCNTQKSRTLITEMASKHFVARISRQTSQISIHIKGKRV